MNLALKMAFCIIFVMLMALPSNAGEGVAKVIILKGDVQATNADGSKTKLSKGMWIQEGALVVTAEKSFAKLLFIDKSSMNVGPNSEMKIKEFPKSEAGIIQLMKGQIRSKVTKDYMNMKDKNKSKLFIKTKTAAMGVRGTDFQVNYNPINEATSLVTFEGNVAMAQLTNMGDMAMTQNNLEQVVSSDQAVHVKKGQYSGASPKTPRATLPIKISPVQLKTLEATPVPGVSKAEAESAGERSNAGPKGPKEGITNAPPPPPKSFRNVIPPGVDAKAFSNEAKEIDGAMAKTVGTAVVQEVKQEVAREAAVTDAPPPEGMVNPATGEIAPPAGGFIDLGTAQYVPPPPGSQFDPNAGVFIPPPSVGTVDPETGGFTNQHYDLTPDGKFVAKETDVTVAADGTQSKTNDEGRSVASTNDGTTSEGDKTSTGDASDPALANNGTGTGESGEGSGEEPPPPPAEIAVVSVIGMDSTQMAEFEAQLAPPPPPPELVLEAPPMEETAATEGSETNLAGTDDGRAPASDEGATTSDDGTVKADDGAPPPGDENLAAGDNNADLGFSDNDTALSGDDLEAFGNNATDTLAQDVADDMDTLNNQLNQINEANSNVQFNINVQ